MSRHLLIAVALFTFTVGFLAADAPSELAYALPAALAVFVAFALSGKLRGLRRDYDLHHFKVAAITLALWIPLFAVYIRVLTSPGDFGCLEMSAEDNPHAGAVEAAPPALAMTPAGSDWEEESRACGEPWLDVEKDNLIWVGVIDRKARVKPRPFYPLDVRAAEFRGTVAVRVSVDESGMVMNAEALSGPPPLRQAAADAACHARFSPILADGPPFRVSGVLAYRF